MSQKLQRVPILGMKNGKLYIFSDEKKEASLTLVKIQENGEGLINIYTNELWDFDTSEEPLKNDIFHVYGPIELNNRNWIVDDSELLSGINNEVHEIITPESIQSIIDYIEEGEPDLKVITGELGELIARHNGTYLQETTEGSIDEES
jgi:hypothetical protein